MFNDCPMMEGQMGWIMPAMEIALFLLAGLGITALAKYVFSQRERGSR
ncbi:hypothetical protein SAMN05443545_10166 [Aidingimonas halophila]|uniref:Uncharacterized protein n=1 Tax=Aidingimonas halophila TaxID=574349 RepID=A0A1H2QFE7_9GAMM|nr:hypothetical protein SAMN05443545_10166 [Aidingimonas halophila]